MEEKVGELKGEVEELVKGRQGRRVERKVEEGKGTGR